MQLCGSLRFFGIAFLRDWNENWPFPVLWPLLSFPYLLGHIDCSTFTESSFRIWNNSTGIPSPPLALFVVMFPKVHLTSHSRMSGSRWVITPSWLSGSWRYFLYSFSVYSCHLFLISSSSQVRTISVLYWAHLCMKWSLGISNFLEEISSLSHYIFPLFLCIDHWGRLSYLSLLFFGTLHSNGYIFPFLLCFLFLFSQLFVRPPQTAILLFCISLSWGYYQHFPSIFNLVLTF